MARTVRLKEHEPSSVKERTPDAEEYKLYNGTIAFKTYIHRIDENGFIKSSYAEALCRSPKVIMLGDSFFECSFVDDGKRLCDQLNTMSFNGDQKLQFVNAGYAASTTLNSMITFVTKVIPLKPSKLVICAGAFDDDCWNDERSYWRPHPWYSVLLPAQTPFSGTKKCPKNDAAYRTLLDGLYAMCKAESIDLYIVTKPICPESDWSKTRLKYFENKVRGLKSYNDTVRRYCRVNKGCNLIDVARLAEWKWDDFYDANHLNSQGILKLSNILYPAVNKTTCRTVFRQNFSALYRVLKRNAGKLVRKIIK